MRVQIMHAVYCTKQRALPQPEGPIIAVMVLGYILVETSFTAFLPGVYETDTFFNSRIGIFPFVIFKLSIYELLFLLSNLTRKSQLTKEVTKTI